MYPPRFAAQLRRARFQDWFEYRRAVWGGSDRGLFWAHVRGTDTVLDLGCGYGEFINQIQCRRKYAMDLNPHIPKPPATFGPK
jgi:SAM-dependent methyltransferase